MSDKNTNRNKNTVKTTAAQHDNHALPDGGTAPADLTLFQHTVLAVIADEPRYGLGIKRELEATFYETVNHGRLYPNLDTLVELGLAEKRELDRRSNEYAATEAGNATLDALTEWFEARRSIDTGDGIATDGGNTCAECGSTLPKEIDEGTGVYCNECGHGQLVTDGGVAPANSDMAASANPDSFAFGITAMDLDDVSVSTDNGRYICTVRGPDRGMVDGHSVIELANAHGHGVLDVYADVEAGELTIEVSL